MSMIKRLASLKLTVTGMAALAIGALITYRDATVSTLWVALPLAVLAANLLAALLTDPRFRRQPALMVFHLCLLAVLGLGVLSRLTTLSARVEVVEGGEFSAQSVHVVRRGALHTLDRLAEAAFRQGPIRVEYGPRLIRGATRSQVTPIGNGDRSGTIVVGDNVPLQAAGYRFYTTSNKGYAAIVTWRGDDGETQTGAVHFPSFPRNDWKQVNRWVAPSGQPLELELLPASPPMPDTPWVLESAGADCVLQVRVAGEPDSALHVGETLTLANGRLRFDTVRLWMGYEIFYDPFLAWLFAAAVVGALALAWHVRLKLARLSAGVGAVKLRGGARGSASAHP